jgi:hypothetical protein
VAGLYALTSLVPPLVWRYACSTFCPNAQLVVSARTETPPEHCFIDADEPVVVDCFAVEVDAVDDA